MKVLANELKLGDTLEDGARVVGRRGRAVLLARSAEDGWSHEERFIFQWPSGDEKEVTLKSRLDSCEVCGQGGLLLVHDTCRTPTPGPSLEQAVDALITLGARLVEPAAVGRFGPWHPALRHVQFTVMDVESTGLHRQDDRIIELAAIRLTPLGEVARFETFIDPGFSIPESASAINGIYDSDVEGAPDEASALADFAKFVKGSVLVGHNLIGFDADFLINGGARHGISFDVSSTLDTLIMARGKPNKPGLISRDEVENFKLSTLTAYLGIPHEDAHRAMADVQATVGLLDALLKRKYRSTQAA